MTTMRAGAPEDLEAQEKAAAREEREEERPKLYLRLAVIAAENLYRQRLHDTDPYVVVEMDTMKHTTEARREGTHAAVAS